MDLFGTHSGATRTTKIRTPKGKVAPAPLELPGQPTVRPARRRTSARRPRPSVRKTGGDGIGGGNDSGGATVDVVASADTGDAGREGNGGGDQQQQQQQQQQQTKAAEPREAMGTDAAAAPAAPEAAPTLAALFHAAAAGDVALLSGWLDCPPAADANAGHNGANTLTKQRIPHLNFGGGSGGRAVYGSADPGDSLLAVAAFARQEAVVRLLLDHGADWHACNDAGVSAAHAAMERGAGDLCGERGAAQALQSLRAGGGVADGAASVAEREAGAAKRADPHAEKTAAPGTAADRPSAATRLHSGVRRAAHARWADARRYPACALLLLLQAAVVAWQLLSAGLVPLARNAAIGPDPARFRAQGALPLPPGLAGDGGGGDDGSGSSSGGGQGWRLVSAVLLHRGLLHLAWCAALQAVLAALVERAAGGFGLWAVASLSGVCGHAFSRAIENEGGGSDAATSAAAPPLALALGLGRGMGAATVVFGLAGASLVVAWLRPGRSWRRSRRRALLVASALLLFEALDTLPPPLPWWGEGVDKTGHLAGFVVGLVTGLAVVKAGTPGGGGEDSSRTVDGFHLDLPALRAPVPAAAVRLGTSTAQLCSHYLRFVAATVVLAAALCLGGYFAIYAPGSCC